MLVSTYQVYIHYGQEIVLDSEGDSELDKGVFAHKVLKILGRNDNIPIVDAEKKVYWALQKGVIAVA